jgi:hypothetical protein
LRNLERNYIGFDVHKKSISFCVKTAAGEIVEEGSVPAATVAGSGGSDLVQRPPTRAKIAISTHFNNKQQAFLEFVLAHYLGVGVDELE